MFGGMCEDVSLALDKRGMPINIFLISPQKHIL